VGFAENVGHSSTYKLLTLDTRKIIYRSRIRIASEDPNLRVEPNCVSDTPEVLKTNRIRILSRPWPRSTLTSSLVATSKPTDEWERHRATIVRVLEDKIADLHGNP
jgi:hypothetical protein